MAQTLVQNLLHLIWGTQNQYRFIAPDIKARLEEYIGGIVRHQDSRPLQIGAAPNHVHCLINLSKNYALKKVVEAIKTGSSTWMKQQGPEFRKFYWQRGYAAFSVSENQKDLVVTYIQNQWEHHRQRTFREELMDLLDQQDVRYNEQYLWTP